MQQELRLGRLRTVRIGDLNLRREIYVVHLRGIPLSPAADRFHRFLREPRDRPAPSAAGTPPGEKAARPRVPRRPIPRARRPS